MNWKENLRKNIGKEIGTSSSCHSYNVTDINSTPSVTGANEYLGCSQLEIGDNFTIAMWVNGKMVINDKYYQMRDNEWHHVVAVCSKDQPDNGGSLSSKPFDNPDARYVAVSTKENEWYCRWVEDGRKLSNFHDFINYLTNDSWKRMSIDSVCNFTIYGKALSRKEIKTLYDAQSTPKKS